MEQTTPKIELYVTRTFTEKLSTAFGFLRENWRILLKYFTYIMLPASLVMGFFFNHFWGGYMSLLMLAERPGELNDSSVISFLLSTGATIVVGMLVYMVFVAMVFALFRLYQKRPEGLRDLQPEEFKPEFFACLKRSAVYILTMSLLVVLFIVLVAALVGGSFFANAAVGILALLLVYAVILVLVVPLSLSEPIYMMEDETGIFKALGKSFRLGFATWGGIFVITLIFSMLTSVLQTFTTMPWYVLYLIKLVFIAADELDGSFVNSWIYTFMEYLSCVLQCLGYMLSGVITTVALTVQYGHASDKIDGVGVAHNIDRFDEFDNF